MTDMKTGDLVAFVPRPGETETGEIVRVWDKPKGNPYVTIKTADGQTFVRCSNQSQFVKVGA